MRKEFYTEGYQLKRVMNKVNESEFADWSEMIEYMISEEQETFVQENLTILVYQDNGLYQICFIEK